MATKKWVYYHNPMWGHHHQVGIVVSESDTTYLTSIPKFGGDYLSIKKHSDCLKTEHTITKEDKLMALSKFGTWWFTQHKELYQYILIHELIT